MATSSGILIDTGAVQRLIEARVEAELGSHTSVRLLHLGEPAIEAAGLILVRVASVELARRPRRLPSSDIDVADLSVLLELSIPEAQTEASVLAAGAALATVAAALDHTTLRSPDAPDPAVHVVHLGPAQERTTLETRAYHGIVAGSVTVRGVAERWSGNTIEDHLE